MADLSECLLPLSQIAKHLSVTRQTVRHWVMRRQLVALRVGKVWRVKPADLDDFLRRCNPHSDPALLRQEAERCAERKQVRRDRERLRKML